MRELFSTIAAVSTPPGKGGVAIIRISGDATKNVIDKCFSPMAKQIPKDNPRRAIWGRVIKDGSAIDDALCTYFPAPNSYTGEDMAEISCHGGVLVTKQVLRAVLRDSHTPFDTASGTPQRQHQCFPWIPSTV